MRGGQILRRFDQRAVVAHAAGRQPSAWSRYAVAIGAANKRTIRIKPCAFAIFGCHVEGFFAPVHADEDDDDDRRQREPRERVRAMAFRRKNIWPPLAHETAALIRIQQQHSSIEIPTGIRGDLADIEIDRLLRPAFLSRQRIAAEMQPDPGGGAYSASSSCSPSGGGGTSDSAPRSFDATKPRFANSGGLPSAGSKIAYATLPTWPSWVWSTST